MDDKQSKSQGIGTKFLMVAAALIVIFAGLKAAQSLIAPFLLAVFFALILMPPLRWLKQKGMSDMVALAALSTLVFLFGLGIIGVLGNSLTHFANRLPDYQTKVVAGITTIDDWVNNTVERFETTESVLPDWFSGSDATPITPLSDPQNSNLPALPREERMERGMIISPPEKTGETEKSAGEEKFSLLGIVQFDAVFRYVQSGVRQMLDVASVSLLIVVMVIFMLLEATRFPEKVKEAFGGRDLSNDYFEKIAVDTWNYTKIKTIVSALTGVATTLGLWFLNVEYAVLWGLLMFFLNYIPNIGPIIASVPPILLALVDQGIGMGAATTTWLIFVNFLFGYGVEPRYLGEGLGISSLIVLLSLIFWGWLLGPIGMFLSAPLTMVLKIVLQNSSHTRWMAVLMSGR